MPQFPVWSKGRNGAAPPAPRGFWEDQVKAGGEAVLEVSDIPVLVPQQPGGLPGALPRPTALPTPSLPSSTLSVLMALVAV